MGSNLYVRSAVVEYFQVRKEGTAKEIRDWMADHSTYKRWTPSTLALGNILRSMVFLERVTRKGRRVWRERTGTWPNGKASC